MFTAVLMMTDKMEAISSGGKFSEQLIWKVFEDCKARNQFEFVDEEILKTYVAQVIETVQGVNISTERTEISFEDDDDLTALKAYADPEPGLQGQAVDAAALIEHVEFEDPELEL
jgi:hypothetical protein